MPPREMEEVMAAMLDGTARKNALDFAAFLRENGVVLEKGDGYWDVQAAGRSVCYVMVTGEAEAPGPWTIWSDQEAGSWVSGPGGAACAGAWAGVDAETKEAAWAHVNPCAHCGGDCSPGTRKVVLGKAFEGLCNSALAFTAPDAGALACAKAMVRARLADIAAGGA